MDSTDSGQSSDNDNDGGLSAGAGAGIGVGCAVAVGIIGGLVWFLLRERRKRRALEAGLKAEGPAGYCSPEQKGDGYYQPSTQTSMQETHIHEVYSEPAVAELYGSSTAIQNR